MRTLLILLLSALTATAEYALPTGRSMNWYTNVGLVGGIPSVTTIYTNLPATSTAANINTAIQNCPSNQVVLLTNGTFNLTADITLNKSGVVLRGHGNRWETNAATILNFDSGGNAGIRIVGSAAYDNRSVTANAPDHEVDWTAGFSAGTSVITLSSVSGLAVNQMIVLDQLNAAPDVRERDCSVSGRGCTRAQAHWTIVTAINGNDVTIQTPIYMTNWAAGNTPKAWWMDAAILRRIGVEKLTADTEGSDGADLDGFGTSISIMNAYEIWVRQVETYKGGSTAHIGTIGAARCEFRRNYLYGNKGGGSQAYGFIPSSGSGFWIEDNVMLEVTAPCVPGWYYSEMAFTFNFATNNPFVGFQDQMIVNHDSHNHMHLAEGNFGNGYHGDYYHGSAGHNTIFRNDFSGYDRGIDNNAWCIQLGATNRNHNIIGNRLGRLGYTTSFEGGANKSIYGFGDGDEYSNDDNVADDPGVASSVIRHMNYDVMCDTNLGVRWGDTDHTIATSLIYTNSSTVKPNQYIVWGVCAWPPVDPASTNAAARSPTNIPAGWRYTQWLENGFATDPPAEAGGGGGSPVAGSTVLIPSSNLRISGSVIIR